MTQGIRHLLFQSGIPDAALLPDQLDHPGPVAIGEHLAEILRHEGVIISLPGLEVFTAAKNIPADKPVTLGMRVPEIRVMHIRGHGIGKVLLWIFAGIGG